MKSHKNNIKTSAFIFLIFLSSTNFAQNLLNGPEAVAKDPFTGDYMVVNATDGKVVRVASNGTQSEFVSGLNIPIGAVVVDSTLFVTNNSPNMIKGFNLFTGEKNFELSLPAVTLANITYDGNLYLYVVDQSGKIFKVNSKNEVYNVFVSSGLTNSLQGIVFDSKNNRLIAVAFPLNSSIFSINIPDSSVSALQTTTIGKFTSAMIDSVGNLYVSSWRTNSVYKFDAGFSSEPVVFSNGHNSPTGLCLDYQKNMLIISNYGSNKIDAVPITPTGVELSENLSLSKFELFQNFPNPFNPETTIEYSVPVAEKVVLKIFDALGKEIRTLVDEVKMPGRYSARFDASNISSGIYFYVFSCGNYTQTKKMILLK